MLKWMRACKYAKANVRWRLQRPRDETILECEETETLSLLSGREGFLYKKRKIELAKSAIRLTGHGT